MRILSADDLKGHLFTIYTTNRRDGCNGRVGFSGSVLCKLITVR